MRLTKIQKALKEKNIPYTYKEIGKCGQIEFTVNDKRYSIAEYTGNGNTPIGIYTNIQSLGSLTAQKPIVEFINNQQEKE